MTDTSSYELVSRTATCKRCGSTNVTWQQGKEGKWYLTEVFLINGMERSDRREFHSGFCNKADKHDEAQQRIIRSELAEKRAREAANDEREQQRREDEAMKLAAWYQMDELAREAMISSLRRSIENEQRGLTMDYFTEYCRSLEKIATWEAEIDMYLADESDEGFEEV